MNPITPTLVASYTKPMQPSQPSPGLDQSTCVGVGGFGWPTSWRINWSILASFVLIKNVLSLGSAAEAATNVKMVQVMRIVPLILIGVPSTGMLARKKMSFSATSTFADRCVGCV